MKKLFFITGASGAGKTTAVKNIQKDNNPELVFFFFDTIGVPSIEEMIAQYGSPQAWQRQATITWVEKIKNEVPEDTIAILDGQVRPAFIDEACKINEVTNYDVILFDCSDEERSKRLHARNHAHLANQDMINWANYLREESIKRGYTILDNTELDEAGTKAKLKDIILNQ